MNQFNFEGEISSSKSLMNRALIASSFARGFQILGFSNCDDVVELKEAMTKYFQGHHDFYIGLGGTSLRFLALRLSREVGHFKISGQPRLLNRPQKEIIHILEQLGVKANIIGNHIDIRSEGWKSQKDIFELDINGAESSQFISAVILSSWDLEKEIQIRIKGDLVSESYLHMTIEFCRQLGMEILVDQNKIVIPSCQKIKKKEFRIESDVSSIFSISTLGVLFGDVIIKNFPKKSLQADVEFLKFYKEMNIPFEFINSDLKLTKASMIKPLKANLKNCPDLFPVLSVLCAFAEGPSELFGAPQLALKESHRIHKTAELLEGIGVRCEIKDDGMKIFGKGKHDEAKKIHEVQQIFVFNPDHDHRLAMAAGILVSLGFPIEITDKSVVNKSFPEFWDILKG